MGYASTVLDNPWNFSCFGKSAPRNERYEVSEAKQLIKKNGQN